MEVVISIAGKIAEYTVKPVRRWLCYSCQYGSNIENLKNLVKELEGARVRVEHAIEVARRNSEEIETDVNTWLEKVDEIINNAKEVLEDEDKGSLRFANGKCLNLKQRHQLSRKAKKIVQGVDHDKILEKGKFNRVSYRPASEGIVTSTCRNYLSFESRQSTMMELLAALKDTKINLIGVWGMGGVGKSTLVNEVARQAKEEKLFDEVAMANVTQQLDIRKLQGEIADMLDLKFDSETERGRARRLMGRLTSDKKILVVLDDIWKKLDLEEIGIPHKGCKVVLISRNRDVLRQLHVENNFGLETLPQEEAWNLFQTMVGTSLQGLCLSDIAVKIAKKCSGLPIALATVSNALKGKSSEIWKDALRQLERPVPEHLTEMQSTIYNCVRLSYDNLENEEVKHFFLYCATTSNFHMDMLKYWYGLGLFCHLKTLDEARNNMHRLLLSLTDFGLMKDCQLLRCPQKDEHFHMHDVVREAARLIASKDHNMIFVRADHKVKVRDELLQRCEALCIEGDIHEVPNTTILSELRFLVIGETWSFLEIPDAFFQGVKNLKVLDFTGVQLSSLPSSLLFLTNLKTLCLDSCVLEDIAIIGKLKNLTILSLIGSNISKLPKDIGLLTHLRLLDLSNSSKLEVIPSNVLSNLVELEELYTGGTSILWEAKGVDNGRDNASLLELNHLSQLVSLEIQIQDAIYLPEELLFEKLERYKIFIGDVWRWSNEYVSSRILKVKKNTDVHLKVGIRNLLKRAEYLCLDELKGVDSVLPKLDRDGFPHLRHLKIQNNSKTIYIIDSRMLIVAFPILETLFLKDLINLENICHGQLSPRSFGRLRVVRINGCRRLKYFILSSIASGLSQLEELVISDCSNMAAIVVKEEGKTEVRITTLFPQLRYLTLQNLPKLKSFLSLLNFLASDVGEIISEGKLDCHMQILHGEVVFPMLANLILERIGLEDVRHNEHQAKMASQLRIVPTTSRFENLSDLRVNGLGNTNHLLFSTLSMVQLNSLWISRCEVLEEILCMEDLGVQEEIILFPQLKQLTLKDLPVLKRFCMGSNINFPSLKKLEVDNCPRMKTFICKPVNSGMTTSEKLNEMSLERDLQTPTEPFFSKVVAFSYLEELKICNMAELKIIWESQFTKNSFCKLKHIYIISCENLVSIFQSNTLARFQNLEDLFVDNCGSLEQVFDLQGLNVEEHVVSVQLKILTLQHLPKLRHVWNKEPNPFFSFQNLQKVIVAECESLRSVCPSSVTPSFMQLESLIIDGCEVEGIFGEVAQEIMGQVSSKTFDKLRVVEIKGCHKLEFFISFSIASSLSQLEKLEIRDCSNMATVVVKEEGKIEERHMTLFPKLRHLTLGNLPKLKNFLTLQNAFAIDAGEIISEGKLDCYLQILYGKVVFFKLEKLELSSIHWEDVREKKQQATSSCRFTSIPTTSWFQNLVSLIVHGSGNIENLLSLSTAKSMLQLKSLEIRECNIMEEVLLTGDFGVLEEIIPNTLFPQLETLSLIDLPLLKWFCKGSNIEFSSLMTLTIEDCPKFMTFICKLDSLGMTASKELKDTSTSESSNIVMEPFFNEMVIFPKLEELKISHIVDLKRIWHNQFAEDSFSKLRNLTIESCENLTNVFQADALARFQRLNWLEISYCESLQEVFELHGLTAEVTLARTAIPLKWLVLTELPALQHVWSMDPHPIFTFQDLQEVHVWGCNSSKSLFPVSVARSLTQLEIFSIGDCGVEEIVAREDVAQAIDRLAFPRVTHLLLLNLPGLVQFHRGIDKAEWPKLKKIWVQGCPFDPTLSSFEEQPEESHQETSNKKLYFMVNKAQAKCVDSEEEFAEDINDSVMAWKRKEAEV